MSFFSKPEWKLLWPYYLSGFLATALIFTGPFGVLYFNSVGLKASQIGIILAMFSISALLFEIPTGAIADIFGRKFSVLLGTILYGAIFFFVFLSSNFYILCFLFFMEGVAHTFRSGAFEAWIIDLLRAKGFKNKIHDHFARDISIGNIGVILSGLIGAFVVAIFGLWVIWVFASFGFFISFLLLLSLEEVYEKPKKPKIRESFMKVWEQTKVSFKYSLSHKVLFYLFFVAFFYSLIFSLQGTISWVPFLKSYNFKDTGFGYLWSISGVICVFAPLLSKKFSKKLGERNFFIVFWTIFFLWGVTILFVNNLYLLIVLLLASYFLADFESPVYYSYFHKFIPSKKRATVTSINSIFSSIASMVGIILAGFLVDWVGGRYTIFISALLMIPMIIAYWRIKEK